MADAVDSWPLRLRSRLYTQFRDSTVWQTLADMIGAQADATEAALQQFLLLASIDDNEGAQLDAIGRLVGQPRIGVPDATYRLYLKARIAANKSRGTPEDLYRVFCAMFGSTAAGQFVYTNATQLDAFAPFRSPASLIFQIVNSIDDPTAVVARQFLLQAKAAGVLAILEWQETSNADAFTFATSDNLKIAATATDTSIGLYFTWPFPPLGGSLLIDAGTLVQETVAYSYVQDSEFIQLSAGLAHNHAIGASVELVGDPGKGWGSDTDASVGGAFAGAVLA